MCHSFELSHQSHGAKCLGRRSMRKGVDTSFSRPSQCHTEEEVLGIERALASFHAAVAKDYGLEEATRAAADWIEGLEKADADGHPDWRFVTARAAHRLALRVVERSSLLLK